MDGCHDHCGFRSHGCIYEVGVVIFSMSSEKQPVPKQNESKIILDKIECFLQNAKIGSADIAAFADFSRFSVLSLNYIQTTKENKYSLDSFVPYLENINMKIILIEERIADREATLPGYNKAHKLASEYLYELQTALTKENIALPTRCHSKAVKIFSDSVEKRLNKE